MDNRKCDYCGDYLRNHGNGKGTPHPVYLSDENGFPSNEQIIKLACLKCEMEFDDD